MMFEELKETRKKRKYKSARNVNNTFTLRDAKEWADTIIEDIENTEKSWGEKGLNLINTEGKNILIVINYSSIAAVKLKEDIKESQLESTEEPSKNTKETKNENNIKMDEEPTDVTLNLQYFFPICDQMLFNSSERNIIFVIACEKEDEWRIQNYLGAQQEVKQRLCICTMVMDGLQIIDNQEISPILLWTERVKNVLPLICVGRKDCASCEHIEGDLYVEDLTVKILSNKFDGFEMYSTNGEQIVIDKALLRPQYSILLKIGMKTIDRINVKIQGKGTSEEARKKGEENQKKFWGIVTGERGMLKRHSLITQIIWLSTLLALMEQDELLIKDLKEQSFRSKVYISLWDAIAYGEGILQLLENSELHSHHHTGYLSICVHDISLNQLYKGLAATARRLKIYRKYRINKADSFIEPRDSCYIEFNVIDMGCNNENLAQGIEVTSKVELPRLFSGESKKTVDDVTHHYGMPLFFETIMNKKGRFICRTPNAERKTKQYIMVYSSAHKEPKRSEYSEVETQQVWTGYQILLPVAKASQLESRKTEKKELFDSSLLCEDILPQDYKQELIEKKQFVNNWKTMELQENHSEYKIRSAQSVCNDIKRIIKTREINLRETILVIKFDGSDTEELELVIKGIFLFLATKVNENTKARTKTKIKTRILFRLIFPDELILSEALRRFSIFYRRGENAWMENTQVAMCVLDDEDDSREKSHVRLILAGNNIYEAYVTAKHYMHNNTDISSGFLLSQVEYLATKGEKDNTISCASLFPFDLVKDQSGKSDFERQIMCQLQGNFQGKEYGCKINNAHVLLGSKVHLKDFYDAELLFQNISNIYRFAYLLAGDIETRLREESKKPKLIYLIGDESYSSILVSEITRILEAIQDSKCKGKKSKEKILFRPLQFVKNDNGQVQILPERRAEDKIEDNYLVVNILPIGTTLGTIYRIKNVFEKEYRLKIDQHILRNYTLILVEDDTEKEEGVHTSEICERYWVRDDKQETWVELQPESEGGETLKVKTYFVVKTKWMKPEKCEFCGMPNDKNLTKHIPLCQVDKTSTMLGLVFPLKKSKKNHGIGFTIRQGEEENNTLLESMKGCVEYGHIRREANHYQYFIDYKSYYENVHKECKKWLQQLRNDIDENEFNIIISPLKHGNNQFLKDVVDNVFQHSLRFMYLSLEQVYREEIKSRFSYIAQEYEEACKGAEIPKYNVYFVDYSMVTGQTMRRSEMLIRMLLSEAKGEKNIRIFKKVILLTNRSSYDTAATFVQNPKEDFVAFSTLKIPSYNTLSDRCPACELVDMYQTIAKCSATNEMYWYYQSLVEKHKLRDYKEHKSELGKIYDSEPRYLQGFCQNLYLISDRKDTQEDNDFKVLEDIQKVTENSGKPFEEMNLKLIKKALGDTRGRQIKECFEKYIEERNWRRLLCTHQAVNVIEELSVGDWEKQNIISEIWRVIADGTLGREEIAEKREWFISYIKVFSREYPSKFAPIRQAIYILIELFLLALLSTNSENSIEGTWKKVLGQEIKNETIVQFRELFAINKCNNSAEILQIYQMYLIMAKRLCDLQSKLLLDYKILKDVNEFVKLLKEKYSDYKEEHEMCMIVFPNDNQIRMHYLQLIKWATMSNKDESKAFMLQKLCHDIVCENNDSKDEVLCNVAFEKIMRIENTRVLYSGIKIIDSRVGDSLQKDSEITEKIEILLNNVRNGDSYYYQNPIVDLVRFLDADWDNREATQNKQKMVVQRMSESKKSNTKKDDSDLQAQQKEIEKKNVEFASLLTSLLKMYQTIIKLDQNHSVEEEKSYVEDYGKICSCFSKIGKYENCCMIHRSNNNNEIIAKYFSRDVENVNDDLDQIIDRAIYMTNKTYETISLKRTVYTDEKTGAMVLTLRIRRNASIEHLQTVYIVLFNQYKLKDSENSLQIGDDDEHSEKEKNNEYRAAYMLFMRQRLQVALERDLYALHHFRSGLEDVQRINDEKKDLCILHLTDLHISVYNKKDIEKLILSNKKQLKDKNPELMLITGDVVQGAGSGIDLEENYRHAAKILKQIATVLWVDDEDRLRDDWKKRIIIIPGNHDYASMNELSANHTLRATTGGVPVLRDGTPMSKYSYFIQFMQDFLGVETSRSIDRNLNSFWEYPNLKLRIIALNSVAEIGPIRNNKMQLDEAFINYVCNKRLNSRENDKEKDDYFTIGLAHHTRCYKPDYFADRYYDKGITEEIVALAKKVIGGCYVQLEKLGEIYKVYKKELRDGKDNVDIKFAKDAQIIIDDGKKAIESLRKDKPKEWEVFEVKCKKTALFSDVNYVCEHWYEVTNERCAQIFSDFNRNNTMSRQDWNCYQQRLCSLEKVFPLDIMLGGHTHQAGKTNVKDEHACIEGARFYATSENETKLNFGRLLIKRSKSKPEWIYEFSDKTAVLEIDSVWNDIT